MISGNVINWAEKRGINKEALQQLKVRSGLAQYGDRKLESIIFDYYNTDNEVVNYKARAIQEKTFKQLLNGESAFYNLNNVLANKNLENTTIYICEGEMDVAAMLMGGYDLNQLLSVPTGATAKASDDPSELRKYRYVLDGLEKGLDKVKCFVLLTDNDEPGLALRQDLVALLGSGRCKYYNYPDNIKDANDALLEWGKEFKYMIEEDITPFPIEGVYNIEEIPDPPQVKLYNINMQGWEDKFYLGAGMLSLFLGYPGGGKTSFAIQMWTNIAKHYKCNIGMFSGETRIKPYVVRAIRQFYHNKLEIEQTDAEKQEADNFIRDRFVFLNHPNNTPSFEWTVDRIKDMKARYNISAFILDPWNKLEAPDFGKGSETQWIGRCLDYLTSLVKVLDIHIMILVHPAKPDSKAQHAPPTPYSAAGSAHWNNKADHIFSVWRPRYENDDGSRCTESVFSISKTRYEELGYPRVLDMMLNLDTGCFESYVKDKPVKKRKVVKHWNDLDD